MLILRAMCYRFCLTSVSCVTDPMPKKTNCVLIRTKRPRKILGVTERLTGRLQRRAPCWSGSIPPTIRCHRMKRRNRLPQANVKSSVNGFTMEGNTPSIGPLSLPSCHPITTEVRQNKSTATSNRNSKPTKLILPNRLTKQPWHAALRSC